MGEFDQCHICIGFSGYLGFIFWWINLHLFAILHIFSDYARFWFVERLCRFLWFKPRFGEKRLRWIQANEVWAMRIKRSLQGGPKDPRKGKTRGPRRSTKRPQNAAHGKQRATTTSGHGLTVVSPTAVVDRFPPGCAVFPSRASSTSGGFCFVLPLSVMYLDIQKTTQYTPIWTSIFRVLD